MSEIEGDKGTPLDDIEAVLDILRNTDYRPNIVFWFPVKEETGGELPAICHLAGQDDTISLTISSKELDSLHRNLLAVVTVIRKGLKLKPLVPDPFYKK
jgi:hypothetical protein